MLITMMQIKVKEFKSTEEFTKCGDWKSISEVKCWIAPSCSHQTKLNDPDHLHTNKFIIFLVEKVDLFWVRDWQKKYSVWKLNQNIGIRAAFNPLSSLFGGHTKSKYLNN